MGDVLASVRVRLVLATVVVLALALTSGGWLLIRSVEGTQQARLRAEVERRVETVARRLEAGVGLEAALREAGPDGLVQLVDPDSGDVLYVGGSATGAVGRARIPLQLPLPAPGEQIEATVIGPAPGAVGVALETITRTVRTPAGTITVVAAAPADEVARSVAAVRRALLVGLPLLLALVATVAWVLVGRALRPVEAMRREVEAISGSTLHRRVPEPRADDEVGRLARTMNHMLDRLESAASRQRDFVSDASHELRSPVATIRTELEVALASPAPDGLRDAVTRALAEEERLEQLLADLLLLASVDEQPPPDEPVDLGDVVAVEARRPHRVAVRVHQDAGPVVAGHRRQLERVVTNLVDNAARHARSTVDVRVGTDGSGGARLVVDDDGPGIPAADRERVFERFTRLDAGRARHDGGAGLGLALVRGIVARHGGTVTVGDAPGGGARLEVRLPTSAPARPRGS